MIRIVWKQSVYELEFSFFLLAAWIGATEGIGRFWLLFSACALHECGHWVVLRLLHRQVRRIRFSGVGILIQPAPGYGSYGGDIAVLLAGPLVNLLLGSLALWMDHLDVATVHLGLGLFNLLPYAQLDGGAVLRKLLEQWNAPAESVVRLVSVGSTLLLVGVGFRFRLRNLSYYGLLLYLTAAAILPEGKSRSARECRNSSKLD